MRKYSHPAKEYCRINHGENITFPDNFKIFPGYCYGRFSDNGNTVFFVCTKYILKSRKLPVYVYIDNGWTMRYFSQESYIYKQVKSVIERYGKIPKIQKEFITFKDCESMMQTYTRKKKSSGGRINTHQINTPLKWNEVTEIAHWHGKGNASVVACNIY